jgi:aminoglycoside phosphotransferase (APT) family kinase protein
MGREFRVVAALRTSGVPVASAMALCEDTSVMGVPFSVVEYVPGWVIRKQAEPRRLTLCRITRCGTALIDVLARLYYVFYWAVELADPWAVELGDPRSGTRREPGRLNRALRGGPR